MHQTLSLERKQLLKDFTIVLFASFVICLSGYVSLPLWFTPVPIATQNAAVLFIAALLGAKRGAAAVFAFLFQGMCGLPVFSGGASGILHLLGPTGGYLIGYLVGAFLTGWICERKKTMPNALFALGAGNLAIYLLGMGYLSSFVGLEKALFLGVVPFILGDLLKMAVSLKVLQMSGWAKRKIV